MRMLRRPAIPALVFGACGCARMNAADQRVLGGGAIGSAAGLGAAAGAVEGAVVDQMHRR